MLRLGPTPSLKPCLTISRTNGGFKLLRSVSFSLISFLVLGCFMFVLDSQLFVTCSWIMLNDLIYLRQNQSWVCVLLQCALELAFFFRLWTKRKKCIFGDLREIRYMLFKVEFET